MLFIDLIDILYLLLGAVIGGAIVSYIDYMTCEDCKGVQIMTSKKTSWEYQKGKYLQLNIKFKCDNNTDMKIYQYLKENNASEIIKRLVLNTIDPCYGCMGASFNDCEVCNNGK